MDPRDRIPQIVRTVITAFLAAPLLTGCSFSDPDQNVHCVDNNGQVVDPSLCDNYTGGGGGVPYWYFMSSTRYPIGSAAPSDWRTYSVSPIDPVARANAGLPRTGKVGGTTIKSGGFGRGSSSDSAHGGGRGGS